METIDYQSYRDIAPYRGQDVIDAVNRLIQQKDFVDTLADIIYPGNTIINSVRKTHIKHAIVPVLEQIKSFDDFQREITFKTIIPAIIKDSMTSFTWSGIENLQKNTPYLFFSNHRDIVLDCALLNYTMGCNDLPFTEIAIGDNLLLNQLSTDLFKLNGGVTVKRSLPLRDKFFESKRLSSYFYQTITLAKQSMWVAQKSGRSKDGIDLTSPAIIKMLYMSQKESGLQFKDLLENCPIVPVAISYEFDPCDISKGREELSRKMKGFYNKKKYEDLISILRGLKRYKGQVHLHIGKPVDSNLPDHIAVANDIDYQIHKNYKLWETNYIAYDIAFATDRFSSEYSQKTKKEFLHRYKSLSEDLQTMILMSYANPVVMQLKALERDSEKR